MSESPVSASAPPSVWSEASVWILIAVNLIPAIGVLFWDWSLYSVMILFWMETAIIGFFQILKIIRVMTIFSLFLVPFFCVHFGGFMLGHFIFITALFGPSGHHHLSMPWTVLPDLLFNQGFWVPALALFLSHGFSFFSHDWNPPQTAPSQATNQPSIPSTDYHPMQDWQSEIQPIQAQVNGKPVTLSPQAQKVLMWVANRAARPSGQDLMAEPYKRVVVMHLTIIMGAFLSKILGTTKVVILLMIGLKIAADLLSHVRYHGLGGTRKGPAGLVQN
jgi:hypothetical protein